MQNKVRVVMAQNPECNVDKAVSVPYSCQFEYAGKTRIIDSFGTYRSLGSSELGRTDEKGNRVGHFPMQIEFTKTKMFHEFIFESDEDSANFDSDSKNTKNVVEEFFKKNPLFLVNGKPHSNTKSDKHFDVVDHNVKTANAVHSFKDKLKAATAINEMSHSARCDVAYFYGLHPLNKSEEDLLVELGDMATGYCLLPANLGDFLKVWVDGKSGDRDMIIVLKKAIAHEVITNRPTDGRAAYFLGDTFLGSDDNGLIDWARKNPREYQEHIVRKVGESEKKEEKVIKPVATAAGQQKVDLELYKKMKADAAQLVAEGFIPSSPDTQNMAFEKLRRAIAEGVDKKNNVAA